jgi:hypothetical protein
VPCPWRPARRPRHVGRLHPGIFTADEHALGSPIPFYSTRAMREVVVLVVVVVCVVVICGFWTSSHCMWMSAITHCFLQVFETSPCRGGSTKIFN